MPAAGLGGSAIDSETRQQVRRLREAARRAEERQAARDKGPLRPSGHRYLLAHEKTGPNLDEDDRPIPRRRPQRQVAEATVPRAASAKDVRLIRRSVNFVRANANAARSAPIRSFSADRADGRRWRSVDDLADYRLGQLPAYLVRDKRRLAQEQAAKEAARPDPQQPPGHRQLSDAERRSALALLQRNHQLLLQELNRLPVRTDTTRLRRTKAEFDTKLAELEEAIGIFSKRKVFVRLDG